jgi:hypothetical protein
VRAAVILTFCFATFCFALAAQDPYKVAPEHYHLQFENAWARATRVTYGPREQAPVHNHPPTPTTVYVYITDGGVMRFHHVTGEHVAGFTIDRRAVKAGGIRFAHGAPETHTVEYLGDEATEYVRVELRTEPKDRPVRDVRLPPVAMDPSKTAVQTQFENGQVRLERIVCAAGEVCPAGVKPFIDVPLNGIRRGETQWSPAASQGPLELVRISLKTDPVKQ